jgi:hypothetical protein
MNKELPIQSQEKSAKKYFVLVKDNGDQAVVSEKKLKKFLYKNPRYRVKNELNLKTDQ